MRLLSVTLFRFGSFSEEVTFDFPEENGLFFLRGDNREEQALEANGAGKSTLWNAISWCVFDRTVKGLRAGDVANWNEPKGARVEICFNWGDGTFGDGRLIRQHSPNLWELHTMGCEFSLSKDEPNEFLDNLRLELEPFLNCILMGQGRPMFLDLPSTKKAELFSDVLGLDVWLARSKQAAAERDLQDGVGRELERKLADVEGELRGINHTALEGSAADWKAEQDSRLRSIEDRYARAMEDRRELKTESTKLEDQLSRDREQLKRDASDAVIAYERLQRATETARAASNAVKDMERDMREEDADKQRLLHMATCPTCLQEVSRGWRDRISKDITAKLVTMATELIELNVVMLRAKEDIEICQAERERFDTFANNVRDKVDELTRDVNRLNNDILYIDKDLDRLEDEAERLKEERNPFASMKRAAVDREELLQAQRASLAHRLDASNNRSFLFNFWVKGFKELRLKLIDDSLRELEIEVNGKVEELGLHGWALQFDVDRENKGGGITRGFSVTVQSPHNDRAVPWESWSGGEGQRLRVAAQQGLADLIRNRTGCTLALEIWDEPTEHLSGQGVNDLLEALAARAVQTKRQIWVVDHRALGFGNFTDVYTVVKDSNGSHFEHT